MVGAACLALGFALGIGFQKERVIAVGTHCSNNLMQIDSAKVNAAGALGLSQGAMVTPEQMAPYLFRNQVPTCPGNGTYFVNPLGVKPTCSMRTDNHFHR